MTRGNKPTNTAAIDKAIIVPVMPNAQPSFCFEMNQPASTNAATPKTATRPISTPRTSNTSVSKNVNTPKRTNKAASGINSLRASFRARSCRLPVVRKEANSNP
ncbi:hypothetical protein D3C76_1605640 [compost metagenome]